MKHLETVIINGETYVAHECEYTDTSACKMCHFTFSDNNCLASPPCWMEEDDDVSVVYQPEVTP